MTGGNDFVWSKEFFKLYASSYASSYAFIHVTLKDRKVLSLNLLPGAPVPCSSYNSVDPAASRPHTISLETAEAGGFPV